MVLRDRDSNSANFLQEHCLMGIKGTVRRNQDGHFIHANIDLDIIITEEVIYSLLHSFIMTNIITECRTESCLW